MCGSWQGAFSVKGNILFNLILEANTLEGIALVFALSVEARRLFMLCWYCLMSCIAV